MSVKEKKQNFKDLLVPAIDRVYNDLQNQYNEIKILIDKNQKHPKIDKLMQEYSAKDKQDLLQRIKPHPKSIAIAQAAIESAWATSRFTHIANNLFGVWSLNENESRIQASKTSGKSAVYVRKYNSIVESVKDYYKVLATSKVFEQFRIQKMKKDSIYELVKRLDKYSIRGKVYTNELESIIKYNKFYEFDKKVEK